MAGLRCRLNSEVIRDVAIAGPAVALAVALALGIEGQLGTSPHASVLLCAIMFVAWARGIRAAVLAAVLAMLSFTYIVLKPAYSFQDDLAAVLRLTFFGTVIAFVLLLSLAYQRAEQALRLGEAKLITAVDTIPVLIASYGPDGRRDFVNATWKSYTGLSQEQVIGTEWSNTVHPDDIPEGGKMWLAAMQTGKPLHIEQRLRGADGTYRWFVVDRVPLHNEHGRVTRWYSSGYDIEDRKRAEEKAVEAERETQRTIDNIPIFVGTYSGDGTLLSVNKRADEVFNLPAETPDRSKKLFHPDDLEALEAQWKECLARGEPLEREVRGCMANGKYRWFLTRRVPLRDDAGAIIRWYSIGYDIEDRKRAEEALAASERNLKLTFDTMPAIAWAAGIDGSAEFFNQNYLDYVGLPWEKVQGWGWTVAVHPDDLAGLAATWQKLLASGVPGEAEARLRRHDGQYRSFLFRTSPLRDANGNIVKWYGLNTDIEDRKRAEEELRRSETFLSEGQRISSTGTFSWRGDTDELKFSEELGRIFELDPSLPVTLELVFARIHPEDRPAVSERMKLIRSRSGPAEQDFRLLMPDGSIKHLRSVGQMIEYQNGRPEYLGAIQDVTQRRMAEEALDKVRTELARVARAMTLGALTASIAHEVNQPLAGIITNAGTCLRMLAGDPPNIDGARETARRTIRDGNRAADVIKRLRALFSKKGVAIQTVDLNEATREVLALAFSDLLRNRVVVRVEFDEDPLLVVGDRVQLQQVILNLVRNGSDAMIDVSDRPRHLLVKGERDQEGYARLIVKDVGIGFPPQGADRLFDAFYTTKADGMGIGLSVSRSIIESHGGTLSAEANDGPGATFSFSIPRQPESTGNEGTAAVWSRSTTGARDLPRNG